jgi:protein-tyrosine phosphatase
MEQNITLPALISLPDRIKIQKVKWPEYSEFFNTFVGVTDTSNWLVPNRILMSAYPGSLDAAEATQKLKSFLAAGITTYVCLQQKDELVRFKPYREELTTLNEQNENKLPLQFVDFEIQDHHVAEPTDVDRVTDELIERFHKGENILIHCWGGHGRTGTISTILYGKLYNLHADEALQRVALYHKCRHTSKSNAPQTQSQHDQVRLVLSEYHKKRSASDSNGTNAQ